MKSLEAKIIEAGQVVSQQDAIRYAISSNEYSHASAGFMANFSGANDDWSFDSNCNVTWKGVTINFSMQAANGSKYTLAVSENPKLGLVFGADFVPYVSMAISPNCTYSPCEWSGYAIAANSGQNQQVYESDGKWYVPIASQPSGSGQPTCTSSTPCLLGQWDGLTDDSPSNPGAGTIVQSGVISKFFGSPSTNVYYSWTQIFCSGGPPCQGSAQLCGLGTNPVYAGDQMESDDLNQYAYNGIPGNNYYVFLTNWTHYSVCTLQPNGNPVSVNFTPTYAVFIAEKPSGYHLPQFQDWYFFQCAFYLNGGGWQGVYANYNNGWGYGVYMYNPPPTSNINAQPYAMTQYGNGFGQFTEHWLTSQNT